MFTSEESLYNLAVRAIEQELVPALRHLGIGLIAYSPPARRPAHRGLGHGRDGTRHGPRTQGLREQLKCYEALCVELGATPTQVALA